MLRVTRHQYSLKYTQHIQLPEMRQPEWISVKYHGSSYQYTNTAIDKVKGRSMRRAPLMEANMNLWHTDLGPENNYMMQHDFLLNSTVNQLLNRESHHAAAGVRRITKLSETDLTMDQRFKGAHRNAIANLIEEPFWNTIMYPLSTLRQRSAASRNYAAQKGITTETLATLQPDGIPLSIKRASTAASAPAAANAKGSSNNTNSPNPNANPLLTAPVNSTVIANAVKAGDPVATYRLMTIRTKEHVAAYWENLQRIIATQRPAVGDLEGPFQSRSIRHAHEAFVSFQDAISSHNFQDSYLLRHLEETRPKELKDIFGIFLEMEANYVNHDFCPRCSLPFATTRYCGEGDAQTPFRKHRGRWAPHKTWGKEWYDVVVRRAEQLWYRATEDPIFGVEHHTQKQVEELLRVYIRTKSRGKAIHFLTSLRGSLEYLQGKVKITDKMQREADQLLDETPHPHLLTNSFRVQPAGATNYLLSSVPSNQVTSTQKSSTLPHSPMQFRIDMEMAKIRREQKEQGAVRLPPAGWRINTENIVPYKIGPNGKVTNWRAVKDGIEKSFLDTGLPLEAYTADELREMNYLTDHLATRDEKKAALRKAFEAEREAARKEGRLSSNSSSAEKVVFPTAEYYQIFDVTDAALAPFNNFIAGGASNHQQQDPASASNINNKVARLRYGMPITATRTQYSDPRGVEVSINNTVYTIDTTDATCKLYGFLNGQVVTFTDAETNAARTVIVLGVDIQSSAQHQLIGVDNTGVVHNLGYDILDVKKRCVGISADPNRPRRPPKVMQKAFNATETFSNGTVIGARNGELYVSWDGGVATPLGSPDVMGVYGWVITPAASAASSSSSSASSSSSSASLVPSFPAPREPYSWVTPFRNDWSEERLEELKRAPFNRERYVSIIKNKYTPVVKRFGYTQHITQDDFVTKEYKDRLTAKQFFTNPQAFAVIPDEQTKAVRFGGKDEAALRLHGLPSVDRNELENGWEDVPDVPAAEVNAIEQALRDISGKRPGNYIKSEAEIATLKLNESWWKPLGHGWEQEKKEQSFLENSADRKSIDNSKLPFGGRTPAFGTTYGIGERIKEITEDFAKGFGLGGPRNESPSADKNNTFNTLGFESTDAKIRGYSNVLVRLFDEKLGSNSIYSLAFALAKEHGVDPRDLLLSFNEWRSAGRRPSMVLQSVLASYLKNEIAAYNASAAKGTDKIVLLAGGGDAVGGGGGGGVSAAGMHSHPTTGPWADYSADAYKTDLFLNQRDISAGGGSDSSGASASRGVAEGFVLSRIVEHGLQNFSATTDDALNTHCANEIATKFSLLLSESVGKNIPLDISRKIQNEQRSGGRTAAVPLQLVHMDVLRGLLINAGLGEGVVSTIVSGLSTVEGAQSFSSGVIRGAVMNFAVPLQAILTWKGPSLTGSSPSPSAATPSASSIGSISSDSSSGKKSLRGDSPALDVVASLQSSVIAAVEGYVLSNAHPSSSFSSSSSSPSSPSSAYTAPSDVGSVARFNRNPMYTRLLAVNEGAALDFAYAATENMKNSVLRQEFVEACRAGPIAVPAAISQLIVDETKAAGAGAGAEEATAVAAAVVATIYYNALYDRYCEGLWVPTLDEAASMFAGFLKKCVADPKLLVENFIFKGGEENVNNTNKARGTEIWGINRRRFVNIPFTFENVTIEALKAKQIEKITKAFSPDFAFLVGDSTPSAAAASNNNNNNTTGAEGSAEGEAAAASSPKASSSSSAVNVGGFKSTRQNNSSSSTSTANDAQSAQPSSSSSSSSSPSVSAAPLRAIGMQNYMNPADNWILTADDESRPLLAKKLLSVFPQSQQKSASFSSSPTNLASPSAAPAPPPPTAGVAVSASHGPLANILSNPLSAIKVFKEFCDTVFPLLPSHLTLCNRIPMLEKDVPIFAEKRTKFLENILTNEGSEALEREFRANADRYWRRIIEGKGLEDFAGIKGGGGGGGGDRFQSGGGGGGGRGGGGFPRRNSVNYNNNNNNNSNNFRSNTNNNNNNNGSGGSTGDTLRRTTSQQRGGGGGSLNNRGGGGGGRGSFGGSSGRGVGVGVGFSGARNSGGRSFTGGRGASAPSS